MLVISYNGNKPTTDYYKYSVQGNNNADIIRFSVSLTQGSLVFSDLFHIYAKVQSVDDDFYDKVELTDVEFDDSENLLNAHFLLESKHTSHRQIEVSLCCENIDSEIVWQTQLVKIAIANGVQSEEEIANHYPTILAQLQQQIDELKQQGGGGGSSEVEIKRVYLTYDDKCSIVSDVLGLLDIPPYSPNPNPTQFVNDSTRIWVNFETTPISSAIEDEIKKGRFIIRLDYHIPNNKTMGGFIHTNTTLKKVGKTRKGVGSRSFTHKFSILSNHYYKKEILLNSLIFVNEEDIKVNRYGEKYVHKKISFFDYVNKTCVISRFKDNEKGTLDPITNEWVRSDGANFFDEYLQDHYALGVPHLHMHGQDIVDDIENTPTFFNGVGKNKLYSYNGRFSTCMLDKRYSNDTYYLNNSAKLNPAFTCYCPFKLSITTTDRFLIRSPYYISNRDFAHLHISGASAVMTTHDSPFGYMSARPRCAIVNDDYENAEYSFLKTFPQSDQQIRLYCKNIRDIDDMGFLYMPIFRMLITQK
jgi:hypothetical protein